MPVGHTPFGYGIPSMNFHWTNCDQPIAQMPSNDGDHCENCTRSLAFDLAWTGHPTGATRSNRPSSLPRSHAQRSPISQAEKELVETPPRAKLVNVARGTVAARGKALFCALQNSGPPSCVPKLGVRTPQRLNIDPFNSWDCTDRPPKNSTMSLLFKGMCSIDAV